MKNFARIPLILLALFIGGSTLMSAETMPVDVGLIKQRMDGFYYLKKAKEPFEGVGVAYHEVSKDVRYRIREEWYAKGKLDEEKTEKKQVALLKQAEAKLGPDNPVTVLIRKYLADYYYRAGYFPKALKINEMLVSKLEKRPLKQISMPHLRLKNAECLVLLQRLDAAWKILNDLFGLQSMTPEFYSRVFFWSSCALEFMPPDQQVQMIKKYLKRYKSLIGKNYAEDPFYIYHLGMLSIIEGDTKTSRVFFQRSLDGFKKMGVSGVLYQIESYELIGVGYLWFGSDVSKAIENQEKALELSIEFYGGDHPMVGWRKIWLAWAYAKNGMLNSMGQSAAEADAIIVKKLGRDNVWRHWAWHFQGGQKFAFGDYQKAAELLGLAAERAKKHYGEDNVWDYAWNLYLLTACLIEMGELKRAEKLATKLVKLADSPEISIYSKSYWKTILISVLVKQKKYTEVKRECLAYIREFGDIVKETKDHEQIEVRSALALALFNEDPKEAISILDPYIEKKKSSSPMMIDIQVRRKLLLMRCFAQMPAKEIINSLRDYYAQMNEFIKETMSFASERERMVIFEKENPFSLACNFGNSNLIHKTLFQYKGLVLDSIVEDRRVLSQIKDPELSAQLKRLRNLKQMLASPSGDEDAMKSRMNVVKSLEDTVGGQLAKISAKYIQSRRAFTLKPAEVAERLGKDAVLLDYIRYDKYLDIDQTEPHYGVVLLAKGIKPRWITLGKAEEIEKSVSQYNPFGQASDEDYEEVLFKLYKKLIEPVVKKIPAGTDRMIICPDGQLNFLNFGTLLNEEDGFMCENYLIRYVASERDLLQEGKRDMPGKGLVGFANPAFGEEFAQADAPLVAMRAVEMNDLRAGVNLVPLPGTQKEADFLKEKAEGWKLSSEFYVGSQANEKQLSAVRSPRVLHLATHGFFLPESRGQKGLLKNPMHRSGLALAGAQKTLEMWGKGKAPPASNDGILTAAEVGMLDLKGTWLVVLSACETGRGEARSGEGVMGLRRGFIQAGTQNLLMTLWPVSDKQTVPFMKEFYEKALAAGNAPEALAAVQKERLVKLRKVLGTRLAVQNAGPFIMNCQGAK